MTLNGISSIVNIHSPNGTSTAIGSQPGIQSGRFGMFMSG